MVAIIIDGVKCHQDSHQLDLSRPFLRNDGLGEMKLGFPTEVTGGLLPDGLSTYEKRVKGSDGTCQVSIDDPISGYKGPVLALVQTSRVFAYAIRSK